MDDKPDWVDDIIKTFPPGHGWKRGDPPEPGVYETLHSTFCYSEPETPEIPDMYTVRTRFLGGTGSNWETSYQDWPLAWREIR